MSNKIYKTGIYARLSREDADRMESNSIQSQRAICLAYIESHDDLELVDTYIDDGETGSNTDRPGFQRMLQDMRSGRIDCAVSKDLSRFSRNYIDAGNYLENGTCFKHAIRQDVLHEKVFNIIRDQLQVALDYEKLLKTMRGGAGETSVREKHKAAVSSIKLKLNALKKKRAGLYESYDEGILNEEEYAFAKQTYEEQYETLSRLLDEAVERRERFLESISPENKWLTMMRGVAGMTELTQELVDAIIEKVLVYGEGRIEVVLNYNDVFSAMCECVEQMKEAG